MIPDLGTWFALVGLAAPATATVLLPGVLGFAAVAPLRAWVAEGAWTGLRATGWRGRDLAAAWLVLGLGGGFVTALGVNVVEPAARTTARALVSRATVALVPGIRLRSGEVDLIQVGAGGTTLVSGRNWVAAAATSRVSQGVLSLNAGRAVILGGGEPAVVDFETFEQSFLDEGRTDLGSRFTPAVSAVAARSEAAGRDASYEWAIWWKRFLHPLAASLLPLAAGPLATRASGPAWLAALAVGWLLAVRLGDGLAIGWGAMASAALGPSYVAMAAAVSWATWRDR